MDPATRTALERMGMRVETVGIASTVADSEAQVRALARIAGHPERGEALVARIEVSLVPTRGPPVEAALWQAGGIVPGKDTLVGELMTRAGFASYSSTARDGAGRLPRARAHRRRSAAGLAGCGR